MAQLLENAGLQVKVFHPLPWQIHHYHRSLHDGPWLIKFLHFLRRFNQRDHRKLCLIDNARLWSGSFNICADHLSVELGGSGWRDYGLCVNGPMVEEVAHHFDQLWRRESITLGHGLFKLYWNNLTQLARQRKNRLLKKTITAATQRVWIASAYFAPSGGVVRALKKACRRGVDVKIIVPQRSDIRFFPLLTSTYYADLLDSGAQVYEYLPSMLHAKALIVDDIFLIGSTNFNHRSFLHDLELDIQLHQMESQQKLLYWYQQDLNHSQRVTQSSNRFRLNHLGLYRTIMGFIARLLRYWM